MGYGLKAKNILLTGPPRCGKSTVIEKLINRIDRPLTGFFTREIREEGKRVGFSIIAMDGKEGILAHEKDRSRKRVGKYGVRLEDLDRVAVSSLIPSKPDEIVIIDEIGKMECLSPLFRETLIKTLDSENRVIGSIAQKGDRFIEQIKTRKDVWLVTVSENNRDSLVGELKEALLRI